MKTGLTLVELAQKIEDNARAKHDLVAPTQMMRIEPKDTDVALVVGDKEFGVNKLAHRQIGTHVGIDARYYDRMLTEAPQLLAKNVNHWLAAEPEVRLVRTLAGTTRAFLSDSYKPLENEDLAEAVLPILLEMRLEIMSAEITDRRLYIKAVDERIKRDVPTGRKIGDGSHVFFDTLSPAIIISNSEVGAGALSVETGVFTKVCTNLATFAKDGMKRRHVGGRHELTDNLQHLLSDETKRITDRATWMQVRDVVKNAFDEARFEARTNQLSGLAQQPITGDPIKTVAFASKRFNMNENEAISITRHLIEGGDLTRYGFLNAITRTAQDLSDYDRASEFETIGGKIIEMSQNEWGTFVAAA